MSKKKVIKVVASTLIGASAISIGAGLIGETSGKTTFIPYNSSSVVSSSSLLDQIDFFQFMYTGDNSSHINNDEMGSLVSQTLDYSDTKLDEFISLIQSDRDDDDSFEASEFIDEQYALNREGCIKMLRTAFSMQSYRYAREVISAIRFSEIDYLQKWFKDLLIDGKNQPALAKHINALLELYREELDAL